MNRVAAEAVNVFEVGFIFSSFCSCRSGGIARKRFLINRMTIIISYSMCVRSRVSVRPKPAIPLVLSCWLDDPRQQILAEHNGREEHEVIIDPDCLDDVVIDTTGEALSRSVAIPADVRADWQAACNSHAARAKPSRN